MPSGADRLILLSSSLGLCLSACAGVPIGTKDGRVPSRFAGPGLRLVGTTGDTPGAAHPDGAAAGDGAAAVEQAPAEAGATREYHVARGDTLWSISRRFDTTVGALLALNHLARPEELRADSLLLVPAPASGRGDSLAPVPQPAPVASRSRDEAGGALQATGGRPGPHRRYPLLWPVEGPISSRFGRRGSTHHDGVDIAAPEGSPVHAAAEGEVLFAGRQSGYGNLVLIRHRDGLVTVYAHQQVNLVHKGQHVAAGQLIGRVGETGRARGAHLHLEVRRGVKAVNPLRFLPP